MSTSSININNSGGGIYVTSNNTATTSTSSMGNVTITNSVTNNHTIKLYVLGEYYDYKSSNLFYGDNWLYNTIASLNVLGEPYWIELKKQEGFHIEENLEKFIEKRLKIKRRTDNIDKLVDNE